jgi:hypothetical protein
MQAEVKLLLLKLIKSNGNVSPLIKSGYEYAQIIQLIDSLVEDGKIQRNSSKLDITENGLLEIEHLNRLLKRTNSSLWIEPAYANRISKLEKNDVFLPDQNDLSF